MMSVALLNDVAPPLGTQKCDLFFVLYFSTSTIHSQGIKQAYIHLEYFISV
jgi:hypothetical protein